MNSTQDKRLSKKAPCPCGSGKKYGSCCYEKKFTYMVSPSGEVHKVIPIAPELLKELKRSNKEFSEIFGRKTGKHDLVHFGQFIAGFDETDEILEKAARKAGLTEHLIFATRRTGFIVGENTRKMMTENDYQEWVDAIDEYHLLKEAGSDPFHIFTYLSPAEFEQFKECLKELKSIIVIGFNSVRRHGSLRQERDFYQFLMACSALNSYRTIHDMYNQRYDDDCLSILRGIYEQYLRIKALRIQENLAKRFEAMILAYVGEWTYKLRNNGSINYGIVVNPETGQETKVSFSNFALASISDFKFETLIYGELYNELSGQVHHDVTLWALKSFANKKVTLDRDQDKIRAIILIFFVSILLFKEFTQLSWLPRQSKRDLDFCSKKLAKMLWEFVRTDNVRDNAGVPICVIPTLTYIFPGIGEPKFK